MKRRNPGAHTKWQAVAIVVVAVIAWSTTSRLDGTTSGGNGDAGTHLSTASSTVAVVPNIAQIFNFTLTGASSGDSGAYDVAPADTLVVFVELFGRSTVQNVIVEDGPNDTFVQQAYQLQYANGGTHGFAVWTCADVDGGPYTDVNVTLAGGTTYNAAVEVVDVNGGNPYGGNPIPFVDQVADTVTGVNRYPNEHITAHADDLVLGGIGTWSWNNFTAQSPASLGDQVTTNSSGGGMNVTAGVLTYTNHNSTQQSVWMNATLTSSAPWIECIITIGATEYTQTFPVTFTETGLPAGTTWCQGLTGMVSTVACGASSLTTYVINGTYEWNISVVSNETWYDPVLGEDGYLTVTGTSAQLDFNLVDGCTSRCIQHVVVIVFENEALSTVNKYGTYEDNLSRNYEGDQHFYAPCHPSAPEYLAMVSATTDQCPYDAYPGSNPPSSGGGVYKSWENITLGDLLQNHSTYNSGDRNYTGNFNWSVYAENLPMFTGSGTYPNTCTNPSHYDKIVGGTSGFSLFASKHTGFLYEDSMVHNASFCESHLFSVEPGKYDSSRFSFNQTVADGNMTNLSFVIPNMCDDGHDNCSTATKTVTGPNATCDGSSCVAKSSPWQVSRQADPWLKWFLGDLLLCSGPYSNSVSPSAHSNCEKEIPHTLFLVTYDESAGTSYSVGIPKAQVPGYASHAYNNFALCLSKTSNSRVVCGGSTYFTVVFGNKSLMKGHGSNYLYPTGLSLPGHKDLNTTDYAIVDLVEWLFDLTNFEHAYNVSKNSGSLGKLSNSGWLDSLWFDDKLNFNPSRIFVFSSNGY